MNDIDKRAKDIIRLSADRFTPSEWQIPVFALALAKAEAALLNSPPPGTPPSRWGEWWEKERAEALAAIKELAETGDA